MGRCELALGVRVGYPEWIGWIGCGSLGYGRQVVLTHMDYKVHYVT